MSEKRIRVGGPAKRFRRENGEAAGRWVCERVARCGRLPPNASLGRPWGPQLAVVQDMSEVSEACLEKDRLLAAGTTFDSSVAVFFILGT